MGYDIYTRDNNGNNMHYLRAPANTFGKLKEAGYDWFDLIDAVDCDGFVSGRGFEKKIKLDDIKIALKVLEFVNINNKLKKSVEKLVTLLDPLGTNKSQIKHIKTSYNVNLDLEFVQHQIQASIDLIPRLEEFLKEIISWCEHNSKSEIEIFFG